MKKHLIFSGLALVFLASGCTAGISTSSSSSLQREVDTLKMEVADLKDRSGYGAATPAPGASSMETNQMRQQLDYINARLDRLENKVGLKALEADAVPMGLPAPVVVGTPVVTSPPVIGGAPGGGLTPPPIIEPDGGGAVTAPPQAQLSAYDQGKSLFDQKDYPSATNKFYEYLSMEPGGKNASAAQFYIGESLFAQQNYEKAILEYQKVVTNYAKSNHVSNALLKQGISFQSIGQKDSAKLLYEKVVRTYPKSYAAGVAKERLKNI